MEALTLPHQGGSFEVACNLRDPRRMRNTSSSISSRQIPIQAGCGDVRIVDMERQHRQRSVTAMTGGGQLELLELPAGAVTSSPSSSCTGSSSAQAVARVLATVTEKAQELGVEVAKAYLTGPTEEELLVMLNQQQAAEGAVRATSI